MGKINTDKSFGVQTVAMIYRDCNKIYVDVIIQNFGDFFLPDMDQSMQAEKMMQSFMQAEKNLTTAI